MLGLSGMKKDIHPTYHSQAVVTCACGNTFKINATRKELSVDLCSACNHFYTGKKKLIDSGGQLEKFKQRMEKAKAHQAQGKKAKPAAKADNTKKEAAKADKAESNAKAKQRQ